MLSQVEQDNFFINSGPAYIFGVFWKGTPYALQMNKSGTENRSYKMFHEGLKEIISKLSSATYRSGKINTDIGRIGTF